MVKICAKSIFCTFYTVVTFSFVEIKIQMWYRYSVNNVHNRCTQTFPTKYIRNFEKLTTLACL